MGGHAFEKRWEGGWLFPEEIVIIGIDAVDGKVHKKGEHVLWDERINMPTDDTFVLSLLAEGNKVPVLVNKDGEKWFCVDGRRRVIHARLANKELALRGEPLMKVKVMGEKGDDNALFLTSVTTNEHREEDNILTKAEKAARLIGRGVDKDRVALAFKIKGRALDNYLKLNDLHVDVKEAIRSGKIAPNAALKLVTLKKDDQAKMIAEILAGGDAKGATTSKTVAAKVRNKKTGDLYQAPTKRELRAILSAFEAGDVVLSNDILKTVRIVLGDIPAKQLTAFEVALNKVREVAKAPIKAPKIKKVVKKKKGTK